MDVEALRTKTLPGLLVERARARPRRVAFRAKELGVYRETSRSAPYNLFARLGDSGDVLVDVVGLRPRERRHEADAEGHRASL